MEFKFNTILRTHFYFYCAIILSFGIFIGIVIQSLLIPIIILFIFFIFLYFIKTDTIYIFLLAGIIFISGWFISSVRIFEINQKLGYIDSLHGKSVEFSAVI